MKGAILLNYYTQYEEKRVEARYVDCSLSNNRDELLIQLFQNIQPIDLFTALNEYPHDNYACLGTLLSSICMDKHLVLGSGSEDLICRINHFLLQKKSVGIVKPNFYRISQTLPFHYSVLVSCSKTDLSLDTQPIADSIEKNKLEAVWISNPNTITGKGFTCKELEKLIRAYPSVLFIIDEASIDSIINIAEYSSMCIDTAPYDNLITLRTFSKFYGMPGLRLGYAAMSSCIFAEILQNNGQVFPINNANTLLVKKISEAAELFKDIRLKITEHKERLLELISKSKFLYGYTSLTNVMLVGSHQFQVWAALEERGILTYALSDEVECGFEDCVRLTIHSSEMLFQRLYNALEAIAL